MNIFALDNNPIVAARKLKWGHVPKMILESTQMLSCVLEESKSPYKRTHYNHPCSIWVRHSSSNFRWLIDYAYELCNIYKNRQNRTHACESVLNHICSHVDFSKFAEKQLTPFAMAMPKEYQCDDPVVAYNNYYNNAKAHIRT